MIPRPPCYAVALAAAIAAIAPAGPTSGRGGDARSSTGSFADAFAPTAVVGPSRRHGGGGGRPASTTPAWVRGGVAPSFLSSPAKSAAAADPTVGGGKGRDGDKDDEIDDDPVLSTMPWGDFQSWALRDNLPRYLVTMPALGSPSSSVDGPHETYALWRNLAQDVTELSGYNPRYLAAAHARDVKRAGTDGKGDEEEKGGKGSAPPRLLETPGILPFLDQFEFAPDGGVSGRAYGLPGIADGTMVETSAVSDVESTVPRGYVRTEDGIVAYELGVPAGEFYSLDGTAGAMTEKARRAMLQAVARTAGSIKGGDVASAALAAGSAVGEGNAMLMNMAGATTVLLAGATAMNMLSHHLTVNVFWV